MVSLLVLLACGAPTPVAPPSSVPTKPTALVDRKDVSIEDLDAARLSGARIIDVRTPEEFAAGHVPGAVNSTVEELDPLSDAAWPKDQPIYLICERGGRSAAAADKLAAAGYDARNVTGGTAAWREKGLPLVVGLPATP